MALSECSSRLPAVIAACSCISYLSFASSSPSLSLALFLKVESKHSHVVLVNKTNFISRRSRASGAAQPLLIKRLLFIRLSKAESRLINDWDTMCRLAPEHLMSLWIVISMLYQSAVCSSWTLNTGWGIVLHRKTQYEGWRKINDNRQLRTTENQSRFWGFAWRVLEGFDSDA